MVKAIVVVAALGSARRADSQLKPLVGVTSVTTSSEVRDSTYTPWQVIAAGAMGQWCVNTATGGIGETMTIAFDPPASPM